MEEIIEKVILMLDKFLVGNCLKQYKFGSEEEKEKRIIEIKEYVINNSEKVSGKAKDLFLQLENIDFYSADIVDCETIFNSICSLRPNYPIEYWALKNVETDSIRPMKTWKKFMSNEEIKNKDLLKE